jgi:SAM-dependent methyltransferase
MVDSVQQNVSFFLEEHERYQRAVAGLDTYQRVRAAIDRETEGTTLLLDVGNGGAFGYDASLAERIVAVDLFLEQLPRSVFPPNVEPRDGDALALDEADGTYDAVLLAFVFHHLVGKAADDLLTNVRRAITEARRVLKPGGRLVVVESCVAEWFYRVERVLFAPLSAVAATRVMKHPATLQVTPEILHGLIAEELEVERDEVIPVGRWILQFGRRWPSALTPARLRLVTARKLPPE